MAWPTCRDGFLRRKLTTFASQVIQDFLSLPYWPRKVIVLQEPSPEILVTDLDLASWKHMKLGVFLPYTTVGFSEGRVWINEDEEPQNYLSWGVRVHGSSVSAFAETYPMGPWNTNYTIWEEDYYMGVKRVAAQFHGSNDSIMVVGRTDYYPEVENVTSLLIKVVHPEAPYPAGTLVAVV